MENKQPAKPAVQIVFSLTLIKNKSQSKVKQGKKRINKICMLLACAKMVTTGQTVINSLALLLVPLGDQRNRPKTYYT